MRVHDVREFLEMLRDWAEKYPDTNEALSRVAPVQRTFTFHSAAEFETQAKALALEFAKELAGKRFYVRMHRRGWKDELGTPTEERVIGSAVYDELERRGTPASVDFEHPDAVLAVETLGNRAGVSLWTRVDLERYPFLKLD